MASQVSAAPPLKADPETIRIATFNVSLYDKKEGVIRERLAGGNDVQASKIAAIIQTVRPDVLLVNEIDYDKDGVTARLFADQFLAKSQHGKQPIEYPYVYAAPSNTGIDSSLDLNKDGKKGNATDAWGFGLYPGQYSFAVMSRFPFDEANIRTFQKFLWKKMPGALRPVDPTTEQPYYSDEVWDSLRLSSKNHVDVPIRIGDHTLHMLASHPTPPVFDGPEDRNGCRNHDEVQLWNHYITEPDAAWLTDDQGRTGGIAKDAMFVIAGDLNTDLNQGDSKQQAIRSLIDLPQITDVEPKRSDNSQGSQTASFGPRRLMRIDYVLPSVQMTVKNSAVFWPLPTSDDHTLTLATDHRMVWIEVELP